MVTILNFGQQIFFSILHKLLLCWLQQKIKIHVSAPFNGCLFLDTSLMKVQTLGTGHALVYTEHLVGSVAGYSRKELNLSFAVTAIIIHVAGKVIEVNTLAPLPYNLPAKFQNNPDHPSSWGLHWPYLVKGTDYFTL